MGSELIINSSSKDRRIALLKDKKLVEFHQEDSTKQFNVGDIYLGTVRKLNRSLNAAFVDVGYEKDAFLHYLDLGPKVKSLNKLVKKGLTRKINGKLSEIEFEPEIEKSGQILDVLKNNQLILTQIVKEPISTKGPRLTCELSIKGRFLILLPFSDSVNLSKKITSSKERKRLIKLISSIKPTGFGVIVRTVAAQKEVKDLNADLTSLLEKWNESIKSLRTAKPRELVMEEMHRTSSLVRDILNESFDKILIDDKDLYEEIKEYVKEIAPDKESIVSLYKGKTKLFESYGLEKQIKTSFGKSVNLPQGGYLIIEHTEALHVIDVNSGSSILLKSEATNIEENVLHVNMLAATEIARQLRLRDMGGIIVIDFIDMKKADHRKELYQFIKELMSEDRSKYTVLPLSKFGLMQITRQRVRPEILIQTKEMCPACNGTGKIVASMGVADRIENLIGELIKSKKNKFIISVHPYLFGYFTAGLLSTRMKWFFKHLKWINLVEDSSLAITEFKIKDCEGKKIQI